MPITPGRGVYRCRERVDGQRAWYGVDSAGHLIPPGIRVAFPGEDEGDVVAAIQRELDRLDPLGPKLRLMRGDRRD